ncbi:hypothetical protein N7462_004101 [Penicillium macrosclerotiorum]|uniref:uncharacterized protein n=1 Tax=Penicillium macrosclerotiorum TaxID=303699 RepID=UPI002547E9B3|nr:uncharacterized protein N7462_004101 [Penicillium macrosclerotiorum]KAJ5689709.1 hypothetical protein N7462_004101 [Penicillium macrosclerotiorum]
MSKGALAHRIEILEAQLAASLESNLPDPAREQGRMPRRADTTPDMSERHLGGVIRFLTLSHGVNEEPPYLGPSSGLSMAENVHQIVHRTVGTKLLPINDRSHESDMTISIGEATKAVPPNDITGSQILNGYFNNMHVRLPFVNRTEILDLHATRHQAPGSTPEAQFGQFKLFMIYAIGAEICQMTETYDSTPPSAFLVTALQFDATLRESISVASIEAMLLMVLYNLRSTSNSSVWYMIGLAMRTCVDFGFHRESRYRRLQPYEAELRRRLFWSVYIIERSTAWSLGRPFSIPEEEIDTLPPHNIDDCINNNDVVEQLINNLGIPEKTQKGTLGRFIASIQLQRIVSKIHTRIYRVDKHISTLVPEIAPLLSSLEDFKRTLSSLDLHEGDFVHMHWNNSIRILLQPFIGIISPQDKLLSTCLYTSGQMCQFFKKLRQRDSSGYSFLLINSIFMAGITMCFCLFRSPGLWTPTVSNDLRACSSALFVMAERNSRVKSYRDYLESIINRAMDFVQEWSETQKLGEKNTSDFRLSESNQTVQGTASANVQNFEPQMAENESHGLGAEFFGFHDPDLFRDLQDLSIDLQDSLLGSNHEMARPFHGIFTEDFWAADAFNLPIFQHFG